MSPLGLGSKDRHGSRGALREPPADRKGKGKRQKGGPRADSSDGSGLGLESSTGGGVMAQPEPTVPVFPPYQPLGAPPPLFPEEGDPYPDEGYWDRTSPQATIPPQNF